MQYRLALSRLAKAWEAYLLTKNVDALDESTLGGYRAALAREAGVDSGKRKGAAVIGGTGLGKRKPPPGATPSPLLKRPAGGDPAPDAGGQRDGLSAVDSLGANASPNAKREPGSASSASVITPPKAPPPAPKYAERTNAGQLVTSYNPRNLPTALEALSSKSEAERARLGKRRGCQVSVHPLANHPAGGYRHMFAPVEARSTALEGRLGRMNDAICEEYGIKDEDEEMLEAAEG